MRALLDVNVLIALLDAGHVHHAVAMQWLGANIGEGWASCPLTQNGCIRVMSQPAYPNTRPPAALAARLREATSTSAHAFWADDISLLDETLFDWRELFQPRQLTDAYLLALAIRHGGMFVSFDHALPLAALGPVAAQHIILL
jgi:toxin-antitoxin system PIN domain toxin